MLLFLFMYYYKEISLILVLTYKYGLLNTYKNIIHIYIMTETTNLADDEKLSKLLQYVFKKNQY